MNEAKWERWAAATGIAFVVLALITFFMVPAPPKMDAPIGKIVDYYVKHRTAQALSFYIGALAFVVLFLWFLGSLRSFLVRAEGSTGRLSAVAFGAGVAFVGIVAVAAVASQTLTLGAAASGNEAVVRALYVALNVGFSATSFPVAVLVAATSVVVLRTKALPQWYGQVGALIALLFLGLAGVVTRSTGAFSPTGAFGLYGFLLFLAWTLVTSILLVQRVGKGAASAPMASAPPM
jgi:hypothetical protein